MKTLLQTCLCWGCLFLLTGCDSPHPSDEQSVVCYSRAMIDSRMTSWYNKDQCVGFPNANSVNGLVVPSVPASWDYVPGVVAKGILDVWQFYQDSTWADSWYKGLAQWADQLDEEALKDMVNGGILDDLNCAKVYMGLYEGAKPGGKFENPSRAEYYKRQMHRAAQGLASHKAKYSISIPGAEDYPVNGGWMHKACDDPHKSYWGQMWCDGAYMGPALLAQLLLYDACEGTGLGWNDVVKQFTASWPYLWDEESKLLYHVLFTDIESNTNARAIYANGHAYPCADSIVYHSEECWGRAAGWYILALVDCMEAYILNLGEGESVGADFETMQEYLTKLSDGLVARQDKETGCWYQLLRYGAEQCATQGLDETGSERYTNVTEGGTQCNYLESSASCLITAALLKGSRLGFINHEEAGRRGFEGILRTFVRPVSFSCGAGSGKVTITSSCQSAGLSKDRYGTAAYYLIGKDVPIQDNTEGKVLGAFLMASVEYERHLLGR